MVKLLLLMSLTVGKETELTRIRHRLETGVVTGQERMPSLAVLAAMVDHVVPPSRLISILTLPVTY